MINKMWRGHSVTKVLCIIQLVSFQGVFGQDPLAPCRPSGMDTFLCDDREYICEEYDVNFAYSDIETYCDENEMAMYDPLSPCNCRIRCIKKLEQGAECFTSFTSDYASELCGDGLDCLRSPSDVTYTCQRNREKPCIAGILEYEEAEATGTLGPAKLYPNCDEVGKYAPRQCSTSATCYCTDANGNRLFGEASYSESESMDCKCSLMWKGNEQLGLTEGLRCLRNGNLDPLQCNEDYCFCYDTETDTVSHGPYPPNMMDQMPCYDPSYHRPNYTNPCSIALKLYEDEKTDGSDDLIVGTQRKPFCGLDGYYDKIQPSESGEFYCSDPLGDMIENFIFPLKIVEQTTCNCATRRHILVSAGLLDGLPDCCPNGDFYPYQSRGMFVYCVDDNGNQLGEAKPITIDPEDLNCNRTCIEF